jgi:hypothetical protein
LPAITGRTPTTTFSGDPILAEIQKACDSKKTPFVDFQSVPNYVFECGSGNKISVDTYLKASYAQGAGELCYTLYEGVEAQKACIDKYADELELALQNKVIPYLVSQNCGSDLDKTCAANYSLPIVVHDIAVSTGNAMSSCYDYAGGRMNTTAYNYCMTANGAPINGVVTATMYQTELLSGVAKALGVPDQQISENFKTIVAQDYADGKCNYEDQRKQNKCIVDEFNTFNKNSNISVFIAKLTYDVVNGYCKGLSGTELKICLHDTGTPILGVPTVSELAVYRVRDDCLRSKFPVGSPMIGVDGKIYECGSGNGLPTLSAKQPPVPPVSSGRSTSAVSTAPNTTSQKDPYYAGLNLDQCVTSCIKGFCENRLGETIPCNSSREPSFFDEAKKWLIQNYFEINNSGYISLVDGTGIAVTFPRPAGMTNNEVRVLKEFISHVGALRKNPDGGIVTENLGVTDDNAREAGEIIEKYGGKKFIDSIFSEIVENRMKLGEPASPAAPGGSPTQIPTKPPGKSPLTNPLESGSIVPDSQNGDRIIINIAGLKLVKNDEGFIEVNSENIASAGFDQADLVAQFVKSDGVAAEAAKDAYIGMLNQGVGYGVYTDRVTNGKVYFELSQGEETGGGGSKPMFRLIFAGIDGVANVIASGSYDEIDQKIKDEAFSKFQTIQKYGYDPTVLQLINTHSASNYVPYSQLPQESKVVYERNYQNCVDLSLPQGTEGFCETPEAIYKKEYPNLITPNYRPFESLTADEKAKYIFTEEEEYDRGCGVRDAAIKAVVGGLIGGFIGDKYFGQCLDAETRYYLEQEKENPIIRPDTNTSLADNVKAVKNAYTFISSYCGTDPSKWDSDCQIAFKAKVEGQIRADQTIITTVFGNAGIMGATIVATAFFPQLGLPAVAGWLFEGAAILPSTYIGTMGTRSQMEIAATELDKMFGIGASTPIYQFDAVKLRSITDLVADWEEKEKSLPESLDKPYQTNLSKGIAYYYGKFGGKENLDKYYRAYLEYTQSQESGEVGIEYIDSLLGTDEEKALKEAKNILGVYNTFFLKGDAPNLIIDENNENDNTWAKFKFLQFLDKLANSAKEEVNYSAIGKVFEEVNGVHNDDVRNQTLFAATLGFGSRGLNARVLSTELKAAQRLAVKEATSTWNIVDDAIKTELLTPQSLTLSRQAKGISVVEPTRVIFNSEVDVSAYPSAKALKTGEVLVDLADVVDRIETLRPNILGVVTTADSLAAQKAVSRAVGNDWFREVFTGRWSQSKENIDRLVQMGGRFFLSEAGELNDLLPAPRIRINGKIAVAPPKIVLSAPTGRNTTNIIGKIFQPISDSVAFLRNNNPVVEVRPSGTSNVFSDVVDVVAGGLESVGVRVTPRAVKPATQLREETSAPAAPARTSPSVVVRATDSRSVTIKTPDGIDLEVKTTRNSPNLHLINNGTGDIRIIYAYDGDEVVLKPGPDYEGLPVYAPGSSTDPNLDGDVLVIGRGADEVKLKYLGLTDNVPRWEVLAGKDSPLIASLPKEWNITGLAQCVTGDTLLLVRQQKTASYEAAGFENANSPVLDTCVNCSMDCQILSSLNMRRAGDLHPTSSCGEAQSVSRTAPTLGVHPPHNISITDYQQVRIDQIKAGMSVITYDEKTGKFIPSTVEALMYKGVQPIYKLTTETGKTIRTTSEHPYLVLENEK